MRRIRRFLAHPAAERRLWLAALVQLARFRLLLWVSTFDRLRTMRGRASVASGMTPHQVRWAVLSSARFVPASTCLVQALAARWLLDRAGLPASLHVGVNRRGEDLEAHAWVDSAGELVVGDHAPGRFRELPMDMR